MRKHSIIIFILITAISAPGQNLEPLDLAKRIFSKQPFADINRYISGDYKGRPNGQDLQEGLLTRFLLLGQTLDRAVIAMTILDSAGSGMDAYLHLAKDTVWKMDAFRSLAMTEIVEQAKNELEKMTSKQIDEIIEKSKHSMSKEDFPFTSREEYNFEIGNMRLLLELDENIIKHFLQNKVEFVRLKEAALKELEGKTTDGESSKVLLETYKSHYRKLFISSVSYGGYELGGKSLNFSIGGMMDNTVGLIYVPEKKDLPEMSESGLIMVREIGDGWYLYKTT